MRTDSFSIIPSPLGQDNFHEASAGVFQPTVTIGGQDNRVAGDGNPARLLRVQNADVTYDGEIQLRREFEATALTAGQGVWSIGGQLYHQANGVFYKGAATLVSGLARAATIIPGYGRFFLSDGTIHREVVGTSVYPWGQAVPTLALTAGSGTLAAGKYLVQACFYDAQGNEGPASAVYSITANANTGIQVSTTVPATSLGANIYVSGPDQLYTNFLISRTTAQLPYTITSVASAQVGDTVKTAQMIGPVSGLVGGCAFRSFTLIWKSNVIFRSEAFEPHLYHPNNIMQFPSAVRAVAGVDDGIWVGTAGGIWWVTGEDPASFVPFKKVDVEVLAGSISVSSDDLPIAELSGELGVFATKDGLVALGATGQLRWLTKTRYTFSGASATFALAKKGELRQLFVVT